MPRAPRYCGYQNCRTLIYPPARRCPDHNIGWKNRPRTASSARTNQTHWQKLRVRVLQRDNHQCRIRGPRCLGAADQVDHIIPVHRGGTDTDDNAQAVCRPCHAAKTAREARLARG
ncbi:HNH endonuclease [Mycobacterium gordonae]|uniref:HNH endonuclease n=1 Tax=Mycobacterium gordonae TaxID=1778 RepID=UPI00210F2096|nr:HNH endonuclease signature motif containing protein [Mycobacterium gordonae]MCQ4364557.1 HNH endonuclease [Mycobacterium gordonae]